ncbi:precorrin-3B C(17)-methyltransferase [Coleofasciculus sp. FACHB-129]|uniref:precorrin-3B C(17)-methyltransferase n=1 Tax=Cyanophyceae TaxID=3028117 RepID=UPI001689E121|nr:precorrin-3B C(17)-methyltransferase [Coleofasciculus sp. FACHB-129]MBD1897711.1 precorrin-3B C(17)-methyltransferase [Coleofasciculus sp. FACHB-129]
MVLLLGDFQPLAAIATTPTGAQKLQPLCQSTGATLWVPESLTDVVETRAIASAKVYRGSLKDHLATLWNTHRGFVFCLASGAVVRLIAPLLQDKSSDPAVVVVDENSQFVISLCSGHQGGADRLAQAIALTIGATPVLTGASAGLGLPAVDMLGVPFGWNRGEGDWTGVSAAVARGERVQVIQEAGSTLWQSHLPEKHPFDFRVPEYLASQSEMVQSNQEPDRSKSSQARIWISPTQQRFSSESRLPTVQWHPRVLWVGIGCERGTSKALIETAIRQVFEKNHLAQEAIAGIATIDIKADEVGLVELCRDRHLPLRTFPADILRSVSVPTPSAVVEAEVGTPSVAEAAAIHAASVGAEGIAPLKVVKQVFKLEGQPGAVTVAIAQSEREYTGRTGCLLLVGTGPGKLDQMTPAAQTAVSCADAIIGYSLYIDLISPLLRPGQIVEALPITQERQRAERAIELANWGLTVAVVSSGDCGIYGMAGLVMEELQVKGWDGKTPGVQVFPGITALQAAASRVGAPLMHDFCAISLSDLLTPWEVIEKRLTAAAQADFVTALYNPRSQTRTQQIAIAQSIFLQYRDRQTPVAIVKSAYREDEEITLITLEKLLDTPIDMLTTVLIGNSSTRTHADWMITPRGYLGFDAGFDAGIR